MPCHLYGRILGAGIRVKMRGGKLFKVFHFEESINVENKVEFRVLVPDISARHKTK